jgi:hypothetical protein
MKKNRTLKQRIFGFLERSWRAPLRRNGAPPYLIPNFEALLRREVLSDLAEAQQDLTPTRTSNSVTVIYKSFHISNTISLADFLYNGTMFFG